MKIGKEFLKRGAMRKLDLHGIHHREVDRLVENFIFKHQRELPIEIICGNSAKMMSLVMRVMKRLNCEIDNSLYGIIIARRLR